MSVEAELLPPRYRGPQPIGRGAMGEIYRATDATLGRAVAIKILARRYAENDDVRERFTREALAAARLSGAPSIVTIFDVGEWRDRPFIVMEYLGGGSLDEKLRREGAQPLGQALRWLEDAARALDAAHAEGVVHRDVKPANLLLDRNGDVHVADFGVASAAGLDSLTATGTILGTAGYLSPEQAQGMRATDASDRYALAVVAFELLTGHRPFESESLTAEATAHVTAPIPSVSDRLASLPSELDPVFQRALAKTPVDRYPTAVAFVAALRSALADAAAHQRILEPAPPSRGIGPPVPRGLFRIPTWILLLGLLIAAGAGGAIAAALLTGGGKKAAAPQPSATTIERTVTKQGRVTTVPLTVTATPSAPFTPPATQNVHGDPRALNDQGYGLMRHGRYAEALPILQRAVRGLKGQGFPYEAYANYNLGYTLLKLGQCAQAIPYLKTARRLEPERSEPPAAIKQAKACS